MKYALLCALLACHTTTTASPAAQAGSDEKKAATPDNKQAPQPTYATSTTTREMFKKDGLTKLQVKLAEKGEVVKETGMLDVQTQAALKSYQNKEQIAATGLPDYETVRRLGLKPDEIFHHEPPAKRVGVK